MAIGPRDYKTSDVKKLYALSGNSCYNPECSEELVFPAEKSRFFAHVSDIAHIRGAQEDSARYDESMTDNMRRSYENLLVLCRTCHGKVDNVELVAEYTCKRLKEWKRTVERNAGRSNNKKGTPTINVSNSPGSIATINQISDNIKSAFGEVELSNTQIPQLTKEARLLLKKTSIDPEGTLHYFRYPGGVKFKTNGKTLISSKELREIVFWEAAFKELVNENLLSELNSEYNGEFFQITHLGYQIADNIEL